MIDNRYEISFWGDENVLEVVVTAAQPCVYTKNRIVHFKMVNCMVCELSLKNAPKEIKKAFMYTS